MPAPRHSPHASQASIFRRLHCDGRVPPVFDQSCCRGSFHGGCRIFPGQGAACRELLRVAIRPEVIEQLGRWAIEFDQEAEAAEARERRSARSRAE